jgi:hypothetical protein
VRGLSSMLLAGAMACVDLTGFNHGEIDTLKGITEAGNQEASPFRWGPGVRVPLVKASPGGSISDRGRWSDATTNRFPTGFRAPKRQSKGANRVSGRMATARAYSTRLAQEYGVAVGVRHMQGSGWVAADAHAEPMAWPWLWCAGEQHIHQRGGLGCGWAEAP